MKKVLFGIAIFLFLLLAAAVAIPYIFKDEIIEQVKTAANESLTAKLEFSDVDISIFRHFPKLSIGLEGLEITNGPGPFEGVKLVKCERLDVAVDIMSAIFGDKVIINGLFFTKPDIKVYALSNGQANYDITKPDDTPAASTPDSGEAAPVKLEKYGIQDGKLLYDDRGLDMKVELAGLNHTGSGEFSAILYDLTMKTDIEKLSLNYGGVQYLRNANANWETVLGADMSNMKFTFKENSLKVNDLKLMLNGWVHMPENTEDIRMDLTFGTPANTFKSLLSIIPGAYTKDYADVKASGTVQFAGFAKGTYNEKTYPAFKLAFNVGNADFKYPSLPLGVSNINVNATIDLPTSVMNDLTVKVPKFSLKIGSNPLDGYFNLKTPERDPTIDMKLNGTLNLGELSKAFPMEGVEELAGIIQTNMTLKASMSQIDQAKYDEVNMAGSFGMRDIAYKSADMPAVKIKSLATNITPQRLDIQGFDAKLGNSDLKASGSIDNLLAYFSTNKTMRGHLNFSSVYFDANEWMEPAPSDGGVVPNDVEAPAASGPVFDRWDFTMDGKIGKLKYDVYDITNLTAVGHFTPNQMDITNFGLKLGGTSDLSGSGQILNAWNYLFDNQTVKGVINLNSTYFDLNQFMTEPAAAAATAATEEPAVEAVIPVPENMDMTINANFKQLKYTTYDLQNLDGQVVVKNESAKLVDCTADVIGGQIGLNGAYNTQNLAKPTFNMDMAMRNMGFKDAFQTFATVKTLAPVAQLIDGKFNTNLSLSGVLGKDMMPDFGTLSAAGFLETISAVFNNFKPMSAIGDKLNIAQLKRLELTNTKNWFEVKDGKVTVKPFNTTVQDIAMQISGYHGITSDMEYQILTKVPRKSLGTAANSGMDLIGKEASKLGVSVAQGEFINIRFDLLGTMFAPKVNMKVLGSDGESSIKETASEAATAVVAKAKDSLTNVVTREIDNAKQKAQEAADKAVDSLKRVADQKLQEAKDKAAQTAKDKAGEVLGKEGEKKVDEVKDKLKDYNPFKKKKN